jgi:GNAT superfamily N-acetyltransferase
VVATAPLRSRLRSRLIASLIISGAILLLWSLGHQLLSLGEGDLFYWPGSIWVPYPHSYISIAIAAVFAWAAYRSKGFGRRITGSIAVAAALAAMTQALLPYLPRPTGITMYLIAYAAQDFALFQFIRWSWVSIRLEDEEHGFSLREALAIVAAMVLLAASFGTVEWYFANPSFADGKHHPAPFGNRACSRSSQPLRTGRGGVDLGGSQSADSRVEGVGHLLTTFPQSSFAYARKGYEQKKLEI